MKKINLYFINWKNKRNIEYSWHMLIEYKRNMQQSNNFLNNSNNEFECKKHNKIQQIIIENIHQQY